MRNEKPIKKVTWSERHALNHIYTNTALEKDMNGNEPIETGISNCKIIKNQNGKYKNLTTEQKSEHMYETAYKIKRINTASS